MPGATAFCRARRFPLSAERFEAERARAWGELDAMLRLAGDRPERLGAAGVRRLGELYRAAAADLAFARRRYPGDPLVARLEALVLRARATVYARAGRRASVWQLPVARLLAAAGRAAGAGVRRVGAAAGARRCWAPCGASSTRRPPRG